MDKIKEEKFVLAGDIGGTKTNLGIFSWNSEKEFILHAAETFPSRDASCLEDLVEFILLKHQYLIENCCFGIAGPVINGRVKTTNLPWEVSEKELAERFRFENVLIVNDLVAMAYSIPLLLEEDLLSLNGLKTDGQGNRVLLAPGTGLGMSLIPFVRDRYQPQPSEGGHVEFGPRNDEEINLLKYLQARFGHVSNERLVSGTGLVDIYSWLREAAFFEEPDWLTKEFKENDPAEVISKNGMTEKDRLCQKALDLFVSILGAVAGNLALTGLATGGVYLGGGIVPKIKDKLLEGGFISSFIDKGRYREFMVKLPVSIIMNDKAALLGAANLGRENEAL